MTKYAELHAASAFSFLDGASQPEDLVDAAALQGLTSIALVANTLWEKPVESLGGLVLVASGLPVYWWWRRAARASTPR